LSKDNGIVVLRAKEDDMSLFDHVVVLDETLHCPHGHPVDGFQTKSLDAEERREDGLRVMRDDDPLAVAHREIRAARNVASPRGRRARW
jgi:hypothetical protein